MADHVPPMQRRGSLVAWQEQESMRERRVHKQPAPAPAPALANLSGVSSIHVHNREGYLANAEAMDKFFEMYVYHFPPQECEEPENIAARLKEVTAAAEANKQSPARRSHTQAVLLHVHSGDRRDLAGGMVLEYYPSSQVLLLSYIFVKAGYRSTLQIGGGDMRLAEVLMSSEEHGIPAVIRHLNSSAAGGREVACVLFEAENPGRAPEYPYVPPGTTPMVAEADRRERPFPPRARLRFFRRIGAKRVGFDYVQPALDDTLEPVTTLDLYCLPELTATDYTLPRARAVDIMRFVIDITWSLDRYQERKTYPPDHYRHDLEQAGKISAKAELVFRGPTAIAEAFRRLRQSLLEQDDDEGLEDDVYLDLTEVPHAEYPMFQLEATSICYNFVIDERKYESSLPLRQKPCPVFHSFELDLLGFAHQRDPPLESRFIAKHAIWIRLPERFNFTSEGRHELFVGINDGSLTEQDGRLYRFLQATVHLTQTRFRGCAEVVWSATLAPTEETPFSEYDVIKLMKYYIGLQEYGNAAQSTREQMKILFAARARGETTPPGSGRFLPLNLFLFSPNAGLASRYQPLESGLGPVPLDCLRSGVTEMILGPGYSKLRRNGAWVDDDRAHEAFQVISRTASDEDRHRVGEVLSDQEITDYANVMCGWALGILDFARMGLSEVVDTLFPREKSLTDNSGIIINRGVQFALSVATPDVDVDTPMLDLGQTLIMNPYLMVTAVVTTFNQYLLVSLLETAKQATDRLQRSTTQAEIEPLLANMAMVDMRTNEHVLPNIFNYDNEREVYEFTSEVRGVKIMQERIAGLQQSFMFGVEQLQERIANSHQHRLELLLAVVGTSSLASVFFDILTSEDTARVVAITVVSLCFLVLFVLEIRRSQAERRANAIRLRSSK